MSVSVSCLVSVSESVLHTKCFSVLVVYFMLVILDRQVSVKVLSSLFLHLCDLMLQKMWRDSKDEFRKRVGRCVRRSQEMLWIHGLRSILLLWTGRHTSYLAGLVHLFLLIRVRMNGIGSWPHNYFVQFHVIYELKTNCILSVLAGGFTGWLEIYFVHPHNLNLFLFKFEFI